MKARGLIDGAAFGPDALKVIGQAFDEAWASIADNFGTEPMSIEAGRLALAEALLSVASEDSRDVEVLKRGALEAMAMAYQRRGARSPRLIAWTSQADRRKGRPPGGPAWT
jgi:hypothetical protein